LRKVSELTHRIETRLFYERIAEERETSNALFRDLYLVLLVVRWQGQGHCELEIDGTTAQEPGKEYGRFFHGVDLVPGITNALPYTQRGAQIVFNLTSARRRLKLF
jgi:hypothetical protein